MREEARRQLKEVSLPFWLGRGADTAGLARWLAEVAPTVDFDLERA